MLGVKVRCEIASDFSGFVAKAILVWELIPEGERGCHAFDKVHRCNLPSSWL